MSLDAWCQLKLEGKAHHLQLELIYTCNDASRKLILVSRVVGETTSTFLHKCVGTSMSKHAQLLQDKAWHSPTWACCHYQLQCPMLDAHQCLCNWSQWPKECLGQPLPMLLELLRFGSIVMLINGWHCWYLHCSFIWNDISWIKTYLFYFMMDAEVQAMHLVLDVASTMTNNYALKI